MNDKIKVGIDINEILRAKWLQFDRFYVEEFGEEGVPENPYVYNFFENYKFEDRVEIEKELKEPEDFPEDINPLEYQINEKTGEANADFALFKKPNEIKLTAKKVYNRFMYEDYVYEIHGSAPLMYKNMDAHVRKFYERYKDSVEFVIFSKENMFSIPSTLFFLSKMTSRFPKYHFFENYQEVWDNVDILITADPELLQNVPIDKKVIKVIRPFNEKIENDFQIMHLIDLCPELIIDEKAPTYKGDLLVDTNYNKHIEFEKLINYKNIE